MVLSQLDRPVAIEVRQNVRPVVIMRCVVKNSQILRSRGAEVPEQPMQHLDAIVRNCREACMNWPLFNAISACRGKPLRQARAACTSLDGAHAKSA
jgi:hypothetical protein